MFSCEIWEAFKGTFIEHLWATAYDKVNMSPFAPNSQKAYLLPGELDPFFK